MRRAAIAAACALAVLAAPAAAQAGHARSALRAHELRVDYQSGPVGIDDTTPSLSWRLTARERGQMQRAYQVRVSAGRGVVWDSGRVRSADSVSVPYDGPQLQSRQRLSWTVRVWDERGRASEWARPAHWEMGLLQRSDWTARWVADPASLHRNAGPLVIRFPSRRTRYLRLDVTRLGKPLKEGWPDPVSRLQLAELQAYGAGTLRSQGRPVTASESYTVDGVWEPRLITDGTLDSDADPRGYTSYERHQQNLDAPIWLEVDLGDVTDVDEVRLYPRTDALTAAGETANFPEDFTLQTRSDASEPWSEAHRATGQAAPQPPPQPAGLPLLARTFTLHKRVRSARLYAAGLGVSEARLNGRKVGDAVLEPANTDYRKRVLYTTYDVSDRLRRGANTLGFMLGRGIYDVPANSGRYAKFTGSMGPMKLLAQLEVTLTDGTRTTIATDRSWRTESGPTTFSNWYGGEDYDARRELAGWDTPRAEPAAGTPSRTSATPQPEQALSAQQSPPVRVQETVTANPHPGGAGVWLYDLGRNLAGRPVLSLRGAAGETARMRGRRAARDGRVNQAEIGGPVYFGYARDRWQETWHPRFMYYGFRYMEVSGVRHAARARRRACRGAARRQRAAGGDRDVGLTLNAIYEMVSARSRATCSPS